MKNCLVVGAGISGLAASVYLVNNNFSVKLIESSGKLGGRTYSFNSSINDIFIDNGQHILVGAYKETLNFLKLINAYDKLEIQKKLYIPFVQPNGKTHYLEAKGYLFPFNVLSAILNYKILTFKERILIIKFMTKYVLLPHSVVKNRTVIKLLEHNDQSKNVIKNFWEIICIGALNTSLEKASAEMFLFVIKKIFLGSSASSKVILPKFGLSKTFADNAKEYLIKNSGEIYLSKRIVKFYSKGNKIISALSSDGEKYYSDYFILTIPPHALEKIKLNDSDKLLEVPQFEYGGILSVHIFLSDNNFKEKFYALIDSPVQWIFNHDSHLTLVISDAGELLDKEKNEIIKLVINEIKKFFTDFNEKSIYDFRVIKEKRATVIPSITNNQLRYNCKTEYTNLFLAGDFINSDYPATIESAVRNARIAVKYIINN